jgi:tRNA(fMet)-specific endonuclease VapC
VPNPRVLKAIAAREGKLATCSVVWHELRFGCDRLPPSRRRNAIATYLDEAVRPAVLILPYDEEAAAWHARERARLSRSGRSPAAADAQIAAIAIVNDLILVTANGGDFRRFEGLRIEDWTR